MLLHLCWYIYILVVCPRYARDAWCCSLYNVWFFYVFVSVKVEHVLCVYIFRVGCMVLTFVLCVGCRFIGCSIESDLYASKLECVKEFFFFLLKYFILKCMRRKCFTKRSLVANALQRTEPETESSPKIYTPLKIAFVQVNN